MAQLLQYDHVDISYKGFLAVKNISFTLEPGEILGIVGESGSGKSTLIKAAMGLLGNAGMVTRGDIWYKGKNIPDLSERELRTAVRADDDQGAGRSMAAGSCGGLADQSGKERRPGTDGGAANGVRSLRGGYLALFPGYADGRAAFSAAG